MNILRLSLIGALSLVVLSCQTVPITGRHQLSLIPSGQVLSMSAGQYRDFLAQHTVVRGTADAEMVQRAERGSSGLWSAISPSTICPDS